jgi:hypothetical protein
VDDRESKRPDRRDLVGGGEGGENLVHRGSSDCVHAERPALAYTEGRQLV